MALLMHRWGRLRWRSLALALTIAWLPHLRASPASPTAEYKLKAVFLFNFAQFVEWPADAFANESDPFVLGVVGQDPFGNYLDELVRGEKIGAHPLQVRRFAHGDAIGACHILFISGSELAGVEGVLKGLKGRHILTVSDIDSFARLGGMVRFVLDEGRIRLRVNVGAARTAHLIISSKILRVATIVSSGSD